MITLSTKRAIEVLVVIVIVLSLLGLMAVLLGRLSLTNDLLEEFRESVVRLFSLDAEANVPTWYSSSMLLLLSGLSAIIARLSQDTTVDHVRWWIISLLFLAMSIDEAAVIHEMSIKAMRMLVPTTGYLYYGWVIPGAAVVIGVVLYCWRFVLALPQPVRRRLTLGAALYVGGVLVVEAITGRIAEQQGQAALAYQLTATLEEVLEMLGLVVLISGMLCHLHLVVGTFQVRIVARGVDRVETSRNLKHSSVDFDE